MSIGIWFSPKIIFDNQDFLGEVKPIGSLKEKYFSFKIGWDTSELTLVGDCFIRNVVESRIYGTLVPVECQFCPSSPVHNLFCVFNLPIKRFLIFSIFLISFPRNLSHLQSFFTCVAVKLRGFSMEI